MARASGRQPTLRDVAELVGVDPSTVSKVLNGAAISVRDDTRERILDAVRTLDYRPNAHARGLRLQASGALGLLLPDITNPVYAAITRGAMTRAVEHGFSLMLGEVPSDEQESTYERLVLEKHIDGLLIATGRRIPSSLPGVQQRWVPHVFVNRRVPGSAPSVTADDEAAAATAARVLIAAGHRRLGVVAGPAAVDTARRRLSGFREAVDAAGLDAPRVAREDFRPEGGYRAMRRLLAATNPPTAVFVSSFAAAMGALKAVHDMGLRVPEDVSLVSFDESGQAEFTIPALTTIRMPLQEMGAEAVDLLVTVVRGGDPAQVVLPIPQLVVERDTVAPPHH